MELVQIYFKKLNKLAVISNFLAFFLFLVDKLTLLDPDPDAGEKMNADPDPQPWFADPCHYKWIRILNAQKIRFHYSSL